MIFDKTKVYTAVNADELKVGDKVYIADNLYDLKYDVENDCNLAVIVDIYDCTFNERFKIKFCCNENPDCYAEYSLAYLVERAKEEKWRPFKDIQELIDAWKDKTGVTARANTMPLIWLRYKKDNHKRCMTSFYDDNTVVTGGSFQTMEDLFNEFEFLDGTPCGVKE